MFRSKKSIYIIIGLLVLVGFFVWRWSESNLEIFEQKPNGELIGIVTIGPFCPVERIGSPCPVPPEAYSNRQVFIYKIDKKTIITKANLDQAGHYNISLSAGEYLVRVSPAGIGEMQLQSVVIRSNEVTKLNFNIDTGIR